jgi:hypothetical protein
MNLEQKAFGVVWHARSELHAIKDVMCIGKLIHLHMLNLICLTIQFNFFGGVVYCPFQTRIGHTIKLISKSINMVMG